MVLSLALMPAVVWSDNAAAACGTGSSAKSQALKGIGATGSDCEDSGVANVIAAAVRILSLVVGIAAIIMVIIAGLKYITSGGDSGKVANAKSTLIYALVGLVIAALAQFLVNFVFNVAVKSTDLCPGHSYPRSDSRCKNS
jgi:uncharacterized membrane protein YuzA (DUF378 family)